MHSRHVLSGLILALALTAPAAAQPAPEAPLRIATDEADSLYAFGGRLYSEGRYREAIPFFQRVVALDGRHANAYALLGGSYFQMGDYGAAIDAFERALQLDEGIKLAYLGLVASNYLTDRIEAARGWVQRMVPILNSHERDRYLASLSEQFPLLELPGS
ncbi:MAG TPA: tetratricopeptide repeat protein [Gemmatimonadota bacterium]|nr:tetratricopeptide repeat protein [Gemmatimonadota bacterium]